MCPFDPDDIRSRGVGGFLEIHRLGRPEPAELSSKRGVSEVEQVLALSDSTPRAPESLKARPNGTD
jgi:hypothetical protein